MHHTQRICPNRGQESYEKFKAPNRKTYIQYDYRDNDGELFSTVRPSLEDCRQQRNAWLSKRTQSKIETERFKKHNELVSENMEYA